MRADSFDISPSYSSSSPSRGLSGRAANISFSSWIASALLAASAASPYFRHHILLLPRLFPREADSGGGRCTTAWRHSPSRRDSSTMLLTGALACYGSRASVRFPWAWIPSGGPSRPASNVGGLVADRPLVLVKTGWGEGVDCGNGFVF